MHTLTGSRSFTVKCKNLFTVCEIQCLRILKKLKWEYFCSTTNTTKSGNIMVKFDGGQTVDKKLKVPVDLSNSNLKSVLEVPLLTSLLCNFLSITDRSKLFQAYPLDSIFRETVSKHLIVSLPAFSGQEFQIATRAIQLYGPPKVSFHPSLTPVQLPVVNNILKYYADRVPNLGEDRNEIRSTRLKKLDLTGVLINTTTAKILQERFIIKELLLGETKPNFDKAFKMQKLIDLTVINNNNFLAYSLLDQAFESLETLTIINCKRILLDSVREVLINKKNFIKFTKIVLRDCVTAEGDMYLLNFLETVFSELHNVSHFIFKFTVPPVNRTTEFFDLQLQSNSQISVLDLSNNTWLYKKISTVLLHTPCLKYLDLSGIVIEENLDFEPLNSLEVLKIDYFLNCTQSLKTICPQKFKQLIVANKLGKNNRKFKAIRLDELERLIVVGERKTLEFNSCLIREPDWLRRMKNNGKVEIVQADKLCKT